MKNKFVIISTCYNVSDWVSINIETLKYQSYKNFIAVYSNDNSKDNTKQKIINHIDNDSRFFCIDTTNGGSQYKAFFSAIEYLENNNLISDEDIIVEIDGDDWLSSVFVLEYLKNIYNSQKYWMTYGQYQIYPSGNLGGHYNMEISDEVDKQNLHRYYPFPYSHLKTYKYHLYKKIDKKDLIDPRTNDYFKYAFDHGLCIPMVEMAGKSRIYRCDDILYVLNRSEELKNEGKLKTSEQKETENLIRKGKVYKKL